MQITQELVIKVAIGAAVGTAIVGGGVALYAANNKKTSKQIEQKEEPKMITVSEKDLEALAVKAAEAAKDAILSGVDKKEKKESKKVEKITADEVVVSPSNFSKQKEPAKKIPNFVQK